MSFVVIAVCVASLLPAVAQVLTVPRRANSVVQVFAKSPTSTLVGYLVLGLLVTVCAIIVIQRMRTPTAVRTSDLVLLLLPWIVIVLLSLVQPSGVVPPIGALYPLVVVTIFLASPALRDGRIVGWVTTGLAVVSMAAGIVLPGIALMHGTSGEITGVEKSLVSSYALAGPFGHSNNLGGAMALGSACVLLFTKVRHRLVALALTTAALLWSASRTGLFAFGAAVALVTVVYLAKRARSRYRIAFAGLVAASALVVILPLVTTDRMAFSARGAIWLGSLQAWRGSPLLGEGFDWYARIGRIDNDLVSSAFHGHNLMVHFLVTGGLLLTASIGLLLATAIVKTARWAAAGQFFPTAFMAAFLAGSALEVFTRFRDVDPLFYVGTLPLILIVMSAPPPVGAAGADRLPTSRRSPISRHHHQPRIRPEL